MKFSVLINAPIKTTFNYYSDRENIKKWQKKVLSHDLITGESGEVSSVYRLSCKGVDIFETIISKKSSIEIISDFEHKRNGSAKMFHTSNCQFTSVSENITKLEMTVDQKVIGALPKFIMWLMAGSVKKHHQTLLEDFKFFVEKE